MISDGLERLLREMEVFEIEERNAEIVTWIQSAHKALSTKNLRDILYSLQDILKKNDADPYNEKSPYYHFLLAYIYNALEQTDKAIENIDSSTSGFRKLGKEKEQQQAICNWLWGLLLYQENDQERAKKKMESAVAIFEKLDEEQYRRGDYTNKYKKLLEEIKESEHFFKSMERKPKSFLGKVKSVLAQPQKKVESSEPQNTPIKDSGHEKSNAININPSIDNDLPPNQNATPKSHNPHLRHIVIPVDIRAIENLDIDSIPLVEPEYFEKLKTYEELSKNNVNKRDILIPSFPILGQAGASASGEPEEDGVPEMAGMVDETHKIKFDEKEYRVELLDNRTITTRDKNRYGWLKVMGNSMNNATPIPIEEGNYVLFHVDHAPQNCLGKIVVASLPDFETQIPQLVIKRLVKLGDGSMVLHSETLEKSATNESPSVRNIKVERDNQITGEVVAIAKPA